MKNIKENEIDYKTAYEVSFECNEFLFKKYNEVKKQKDDVVKLIKKTPFLYSPFKEEVLRMLGEIDDN